MGISNQQLVLLFFFLGTGADESFQFFGQVGSILLRQFQETEGLEAAFGGPHGEEHFGARADTGRSDMKQDGDLDSFVERVLQREQSAVRRELTHAGAYLPPVFEQCEGKNGPAEFDPQAPFPSLRTGRSGHILCHYRTGGRGYGRLPKAFVLQVGL
jgi:hypothetical protein